MSAFRRSWWGPALTLAIILTAQAQGQALRPGSGYDGFPGRPDPWATGQRECGLPLSFEGIGINPDTASSAVLRDLLAQPGVPATLIEARLRECLRFMRRDYVARYGVDPSAPKRCGAEREGTYWPWVLRGMCLGPWRQSISAGYDCIATQREIRDATFLCPAHYECIAGPVLNRPGYTPENRALQCDPGQPMEWEGRTGAGCRFYLRQQRPECSKVSEPPPPPPPPPLPPPTEPECEPESESRWAAKCVALGHPDLTECREWTLANSPERTVWRLLQVVCPKEVEPEPEPEPEPPPPVETCLRCSWEGGEQLFRPGAPSTGKLEIELVCRGVECPEEEGP